MDNEPRRDMREEAMMAQEADVRLGGAGCPAPTAGVSAQHGRTITIRPLNYGYEVTVGCQTFAIETVDSLLGNLDTYLRNPAEIEKKWLAGKYQI